MQISETLDKKLNKYAELMIKKGANVIKDQTVIIYAEPSQEYFVLKMVKEAYAAGAKYVTVDWRCQALSKISISSMSDELLDQTPQYEIDRFKELVINQKATRISLLSDDPDGMNGVDLKKLAIATKAFQRDLKFVMDATLNDDISWLVVAASSVAWAEKVFPNLKGQEAFEALWDAILKAVYVEEDNDPIATWDQHIIDLNKHAKWLNEKNFKELKYKSKTADITIGLAENHIWEAALSKDKSGKDFIANMPTEEVFTSPDNRNINGTIKSTLPLSYRGELIEDIELEFKDGKIVNFSASKGEAQLKEIIETDEGAKSLGEVSLVPYPSPISQSGIIFFNTLFDENASNHIAIGAAYSSNIKDGKTSDKEELQKFGWNVSDVHIDFMVGSNDLDIDGVTYDGQVIPVFRNGDWA